MELRKFVATNLNYQEEAKAQKALFPELAGYETEQENSLKFGLFRHI